MPEEMSLLRQLELASLSTAVVRRVDQIAVERFGMSSLVLMENAAVGCTRWLEANYPDRPTTWILCGHGNNGGDGLAIARHLQVAGWNCRVVVSGERERLSPDARANYDILRAAGNDSIFESFTALQAGNLLPNGTTGVILDCMLGTGASGPLRAPLDEWVGIANAANAIRIAIDVPTGVDADSGQCQETFFHADATLTFVAQKPAMSAAGADALFGRVSVLPIGIPAKLIEEILDAESTAP